MKQWLRHVMASGELFIWGCGAGLSLSLLMIAGLLVLILINGFGYFWPADLVELTLKDGKHVIGQLAGEDVSPKGDRRIRMKIGNRDLYGLDFRWINSEQIVEQTKPVDLVMVERREWGNFYGRLRTLAKEDQVVAEGADAIWKALPPLLRQAESNERESLYSVLVVDANNKEKSLALGQVIRVFRPNDLSTLEKVWIYVGNVWTVLTTEPREANTEGGIFPAIFGTVMMVMIMSFIVTPFGVIGALYLREYARQGVIVRTVRIAVNNLAGVPSIVFGVFGLGFFVYGVGGRAKGVSRRVDWVGCDQMGNDMEGCAPDGASRHSDRAHPCHGPCSRRGRALDVDRCGEIGSGPADRRNLAVPAFGPEIHALRLSHL